MSETKNLREHWRRLYTSEHRHTKGPDPIMLAVAQTLPPGRALDIGCGRGEFLAGLAEMGWRTTGIDITPEAIDAAKALFRQRRLQAELLVADAAIWRPSQSFDLITSCFAIPPEKNEQQKAFALMRDALAEGGHLVVQVLDIERSGNRAPPQFHHPSLDELRAAFTGLHEVEVRSVETPPHFHSPASGEPHRPWHALLFHAKR